MVNIDRIVPIQKIDRISAIGEAMALAGTSFTVIGAADGEGNFVVSGTGDAGNLLANQPAKTIDFADGVTAAVVYFIADYGFGGFSIAETAVTATGTVKPDGVTLYKATLAGGAVTVVSVTP